MEVAALLSPVKAAYGWMARRLAKRMERRDTAGVDELVDILRHSHFENGKYLVTVYMRSGRSFTGFVDRYEDYEHALWSVDQGHVVLTSAQPLAGHVSYETVTILFSQIEAVMWQNVHGASEEEAISVAQAAPSRF